MNINKHELLSLVSQVASTSGSGAFILAPNEEMAKEIFSLLEGQVEVHYGSDCNKVYPPRDNIYVLPKKNK